jgi:hypothetical protein
MVEQPRIPLRCAAAMSTRKLIFLALLCGIAILVAFSLQLLIAR